VFPEQVDEASHVRRRYEPDRTIQFEAVADREQRRGSSHAVSHHAVQAAQPERHLTQDARHSKDRSG
jgi:hypothetical protein